MKKKIALRWAKALESGEYLQTQGRLHEVNNKGQDCFCALGVLNNLYVEENGNAEDAWSVNFSIKNVVKEWAGFNNYSVRTSKGTIIELNDSKRFTFLEIGQLIRDEYENL